MLQDRVSHLRGHWVASPSVISAGDQVVFPALTRNPRLESFAVLLFFSSLLRRVAATCCCCDGLAAAGAVVVVVVAVAACMPSGRRIHAHAYTALCIWRHIHSTSILQPAVHTRLGYSFRRGQPRVHPRPPAIAIAIPSPPPASGPPAPCRVAAQRAALPPLGPPVSHLTRAVCFAPQPQPHLRTATRACLTSCPPHPPHPVKPPRRRRARRVRFTSPVSLPSPVAARHGRH